MAAFYDCEFHLGRLIAEAARRDGIAPDHPSHADILREALWDDARWQRLRDFAQARSATNLVQWCASNDALVRAQTALRLAHPGHPRSNAPAEAALLWIDGRFGRSRRFSLRNAARLQLVLALVRAHLAGQADLATFSRIVKRRMTTLAPGEHLDWSSRMDPRSDLCSIGQVIVDAHQRAQARNASYMASAKARSVIANVAAQNAAGAGLPPLVATIAPGRKTASVKVAGLMLTDFPKVAADWDTAANTANGRSLDTTPAGSGYQAAWRCHICGHEWQAEVAQRTVRQTRCQRCSTQRAGPHDPLAALHPELLVEWDTAGNPDLRPERIKATYDKTVSWRCPVDPEHPTHRMSPLTRSRRDIGCPLCRARVAATKVPRAA